LSKMTDVNEKAKELAAQIPEVMKAVMGLHSEVVKDGALSAKTKELMMIGIAVAIRCEYCLWKHVPEAARMGATREEILEAVSTAIMMSGGPGVAYGSMVVLQILDELDL
jgi:AhpD family alkylhydroperoxidase